MTKCTVYTEYKISSKKKAFDSHFRGLAITVSPKTQGQLTMYNTTNSNYFFIIKKKVVKASYILHVFVLHDLNSANKFHTIERQVSSVGP